MAELAVWILTVSLMLIGLVGVVLPLVPGTLLILLGAVAHKLLLPASISWTLLAYIAGFWLLSIVADFGGVLLGTRWFGGGKWGMAGASGGAFVGAFISFPALVLGTVFGAVAAERFLGRKSPRASLKAGLGAATGFVISTFARLACAVMMIALFFLSVR